MNKINLITELGIEVFVQKDKTRIDSLQKETKTYIITNDEKEYMGVYVTFDNRWRSLKLRAVEKEIVINIPLDKVLQIYQL